MASGTAAHLWLVRRLAGKRPPVREVPSGLRLSVQRRTIEADGVVSLRLADPTGAALPSWQPGSHLDLTLPSGLRRQYSLCGDPEDRSSYRIAVRRLDAGAGGSREVHDSLVEGVEVTVAGPRNAFPFVGGSSVLLIAGGIGITPILPMARAAARSGADWRLVYTGRDTASMPFLAELAELGDRVEIRPDDETGLPDPAKLLDRARPGAAVYCCGPPPMIEGIRTAMPASRAGTLQFERFTPPPVVGGHEFEIELARSGATVTVPADRSALECLRQQLPGIPYSCRQGFCGTCRVTVLQGTVDHGVPAGDDASMLVCVSRAAGDRLVLDL